jgi:hypothetical protein
MLTKMRDADWITVLGVFEAVPRGAVGLIGGLAAGTIIGAAVNSRRAAILSSGVQAHSLPHYGVGLLRVARHAKRHAALVFHCTRRRPTFRCARLVI